MLESFLVPDYLHCYDLLSLMVETLKSLTKAATSKSLHNFVAIAYVILHNNLVVSTLVIIQVVVHQS